jgi:hypothetical protein
MKASYFGLLVCADMLKKLFTPCRPAEKQGARGRGCPACSSHYPIVRFLQRATRRPSGSPWDSIPWRLFSRAG